MTQISLPKLALIFLVIVSAVGIAYVGFTVQQGTPETKPQNLIPSSVDTSNWKTYRSKEFGFEVRYPTELLGILDTTPNGVSFWFSTDRGVKFASYEFLARQQDSCEISTASSVNVSLAGVEFTKGVHMLSDVVENPDKDGVVGIQYVAEYRGICYQLNYWERIQKGVRYSSYRIDEMDQFIAQFNRILSTFQFIQQDTRYKK